MTDLKQIELDLFEAEVLTKFFGEPKIKLNHFQRVFIKNQYGINDIEEWLQNWINIFEAEIRPIMNDVGKVNADELIKKINEYFPQISPITEYIPRTGTHFRLLDILNGFNDIRQKIIEIIGVK